LLTPDEKIAQLRQDGFCVLRNHLPHATIDACREALWPTLLAVLERRRDQPNRGPYRHFLPMPFDPPCFAPEFFFDPVILRIVHHALDLRAVADQWGCDVPVRGSTHQEPHADFERPLFAQWPDLDLPPYMLVVSFGLTRITAEDGPIEIAAGTHSLTRRRALHAIRTGDIALRPVLLDLGDVLIRHPWAIHRGTPNLTGTPRAMVSIRWVRRWYTDASREVHSIPQSVWRSLSLKEQELLRFPIAPAP
jgi:hypothetical protein